MFHGYSASRQRGKNPAGPGQFYLRSFTWRPLLTFCGPLIVLAFYVVICVYFLERPAPYGIASSIVLDAPGCYYAWFILVVFMLDWARTGLANIEAAALMHRRPAPTTAMELMWHTDSKWANPLWWLCAFRVFALSTCKGRGKFDRGLRTPSVLWIALSATHVLVFISLPLSGLIMELINILVYSDQPATITGPNATTFNVRMATDPMQQIQSAWQVGSATTPSGGSIMYAPHGMQNVSTTYFNDMIVQGAEHIEFFTGPTVHEPVHGAAWDIYTNVSCSTVSKDDLYMLQLDGFNYAVRRLGEFEDGVRGTEWVQADSGQFAISETFCTWNCWPFTYQIDNTNQTQTPY